ncbi:DUF1266 domain-containing protein [Streptomyces orinoci]|uniref:DUF1266 domain-containing protein n=1 Tax=Streptomyces orinoci TaxID=67339 RepID=A0ABV3JUB7_STRON|nr:DUF1266 domain-containing protein [Streptomyces orinoci]
MAIWKRPEPIAAPPAPPAPPAVPPAWQAPTEVERGLYEAKWRGDWDGYLRLLAGTHLYFAVSRGNAETAPDRPSWRSYPLPQVRGHGYVFHTPGMLPAPTADPVYYSRRLSEVAERWPDPTVPWLAVNPGTPCEAFFPASPGHRAVWQQRFQGTPTHRRMTLNTLRVGAPVDGPVAHGLACGALLCVQNGSLWNNMAWHGCGFTSERERLREWWGITTREEWLSTQEKLLRADYSGGGTWEFVLRVRRALAREYGGPVELAHWREATGRVIRHNAAEGGTFARCKDIDAEVGRVQRLIGRIARYESRFRADGLLPEGKQVRSVLSWDYGRASKMARWGLGARFCDLAEAESAVVRTGTVSKTEYHSWADFSAGYILGRCLHFDDEEFGNWYQGVLEAHRLLMSDPQSPWLTIPWK